jgi:glycerol uptake facilitator-like aquaporin
MNAYLIELVAATLFSYVVLVTKNNAIAVGAALAVSIMMGGGDVNPVITIMRVMSESIKFVDAIPMILVQITGGLVALELYKRVKL